MIVLLMMMLGVHSAVYADSDLTITTTTVSSATLNHSSTPDSCFQLAARKDQLYHLSSNGIYEAWTPSDLTTPTNVANLSSLQVIDMGVSTEGKSVILSYVVPGNGQLRLYSLDANYQIQGNQVQSPIFGAPPDLVFTKGSEYYSLYINGYGNGISRIDAYNTATATSVRSLDLPGFYPGTSITPDFRKVLTWTTFTGLLVYNLTDMTLSGTYTPPNTPSAGSTDKVTFSADSSLALIETDQANPLVVLSMSTYAVVAQVAINDTIREAHFLDDSNELLVVVCANSLTLVDLTSGLQYALPPVTATAFAADQQGHLFSCASNVVSQLAVSFVRTTSSGDEDVEACFYASLQLSDALSSFYEVINDTLVVTTGITNMATIFASSLPLTIYFLGFLNYFALSSLYVLLNFPIPEHVYKYLALVYNDINSNFLSMLGITMKLPPFSSERVDSKRGLFFEVSSDILPSNFVTFIFLIANITAVLLLQLLCSRMRQNSWLRKVVNDERWNMITGQIINVLIPLTLPWTFIMLRAGVRNFGTKINSACYVVIYFVGVVFPIYYLFQLLQDRERELLTKRRQEEQPEKRPERIAERKYKLKLPPVSHPKKIIIQIKKHRESSELKADSKQIYCGNSENRNEQEIDKGLVPTMAGKGRRKSQENCDSTLTLGRLMSFKVVEQWYLCQANFVLPALVLLRSPAYFLVAVLLSSGLGVAIASRRPTGRLNAVLLSLYPFVFHCCFVLFYWSPSVPVLLVAQLVCLAVFLLGSLHHCLALIIQIVAFLYTTLRDLCKRSRVNPEEVIRLAKGPNERKPENERRIKQEKKQKLVQMKRLSEQQQLKQRYQRPSLLKQEKDEKGGRLRFKRKVLKEHNFDCDTPQLLRHSQIKRELAAPQAWRVDYSFVKKLRPEQEY